MCSIVAAHACAKVVSLWTGRVLVVGPSLFSPVFSPPGDNICGIKSNYRAPAVELDFGRTAGVHLAVSQSPLKRRPVDQQMERHSDTPGSEGQHLQPLFEAFFFFLFHLCVFNTLPSFTASGNDLPTNTKAQVYPQDKVVPVGDNTTICCVVKEKGRFGSMFLGNTTLTSKLISRRTYTITVVNQRPSGPAGTNVYCLDDQKILMDGTVVFVGCKINC